MLKVKPNYQYYSAYFLYFKHYRSPSHPVSSFHNSQKNWLSCNLRPSSPICGFAIRGLMLCFFVCTSLSRHNSLCPLCAIHKGKLHQPSDPPPRLPTEIYLSKTRTMTMDSSSNFSLDQKFQNLSPWTQQRYLFHPKLGHDFLPITMNLSNTKFHARYHIPIYNFYNFD